MGFPFLNNSNTTEGETAEIIKMMEDVGYFAVQLTCCCFDMSAYIVVHGFSGFSFHISAIQQGFSVLYFSNKHPRAFSPGYVVMQECL